MVRVILGSGLQWVNKSSSQFGFDQVISYFGSIRVIPVSGRVSSILGWFNFGFRVEIGSTFSHVGLDLISSCLVRVVRFGSLLPGLGKRVEEYSDMNYYSFEE